MSASLQPYIFIVLFLCVVSNHAHRWPGHKKCDKPVTTVSGSTARKHFCPGDLIFEDNFDKLDFKKWHHDITLSGGGNWEFQWYVNNRSNSFVKDGSLYLKPTLTTEVLSEEDLYKMSIDINGFTPADYCTDLRFYGCSRTGSSEHILNPIRSAKLTTMNSFSFKYGKVKIRAKMPTGDWLWPAIWMYPRYNVYGHWPGSGTIIMAESRGNEKLIQNDKNIGVEQVEAKVRWGPDATHDGVSRTKFIKNNPGKGYNARFHVYELYWTPDNITFSVDGEVFGFVEPKISFWELGKFENTGKDNPWQYGTKMAPFDEEFFLTINLAIGGVGYFPDDAVNSVPKPWSNKSPRAMTDFWQGRDNWLPSWKLKEKGAESYAFQIDYVKIWAI